MRRGGEPARSLLPLPVAGAQLLALEGERRGVGGGGPAPHPTLAGLGRDGTGPSRAGWLAGSERGAPASERARMLWLLLLLLAGPLLAGSQAPEASCGPEGCFALFAQRRSFLEAWRGCREQGGDLAALKRAEDAEQVAALLQLRRDGGGAAEGRRHFWIGLQRQPRQCFPQRPLRGFVWTSGEQDTDFVNWARPAGSAASCAASRCVVLDGRDGRWLEGSCTLPADGFVCRFAFRAMCAGLAAAAEEGATVSYATAFGPAGGALRFVPFGTVATVSCGAAGPAVSVLCLQAEGGAAAWSKEAPFCRGQRYRHSWCEGDNGGCQQLCLDEGSGYSCECHAGFALRPDGHSCAPSDACQGQPCAFECVPGGEAGEDGEGAGFQCRCPAGYEPGGEDGRQCEDVDECAEEAPCEHQCENTEGSFLCRCHLGFSPAEDEPGRCADTDECQIPGVCQQMCVNYVGGFECYCTEGYDLDPDGIGCSPAAGPATARSPRAGGGGGGGGFLLPFGAGHEWPHGVEHGLALAEHLPVFPDAGTGAPRPDPQGAARVSATAPPLPDRSRAPTDPPSGPDSSPAAATSPPTTDVPRDSRQPHSSPPQPPLPLTTSPPPHPPALADAPAPEEEEGAVAGGVRALPPASPSPTPGEEQVRRPRDDRWLLVALLVPACVFVVIMLALGMVYCTRCGAQAKARSVTQCYRWVSSAGKGGSPPPAPGPCQAATCRTSV